MEFGEIVSEDPGRAARIGIMGREEDRRINNQAELDELAFPTMEKLGRIEKSGRFPHRNGPIPTPKRDPRPPEMGPPPTRNGTPAERSASRAGP